MSTATIPCRDWPQIATVARNANHAGTSMARAVAAHLGITYRAAQFVIRQARNRGHDIPHGRRGPKPDDALHAEVAAVACAAHAAGKPIAGAVAEHFERTWQCATNLISRARQRGHSIPYDFAHGAAGRGAIAHHATLACDCGDTFNSADQLVRHTLTEHRRAPQRHERTPRQVAA